MGFDPNTTKPEIDFPGDNPPAELVLEDIWEGDGATAEPGEIVKAHYVGVSWSTGEEFDASWNRGEPLQFQVGVGQVIQGWDQGLLGMKVGGRRKITIPRRSGTGSRVPAAPSAPTRRSSSSSTSSRRTSWAPAARSA